MHVSNNTSLYNARLKQHNVRRRRGGLHADAARTTRRRCENYTQTLVELHADAGRTTRRHCENYAQTLRELHTYARVRYTHTHTCTGGKVHIALLNAKYHKKTRESIRRENNVMQSPRRCVDKDCGSARERLRQRKRKDCGGARQCAHGDHEREQAPELSE
ncbi:hypothetical protein PLICRDRAFT_435466 [Plicaturopsis crispa FD-325 SS-3]|uniref:Uncharacterized protein n=1 Tax=Plicaturopsis crispa FD-325 SS-3 TaxID=944288 RepID=A0A0C9T3T9_PLICR|nr:hypothetical protein PLICRDRAFT_435466 [Plicaturopsis crispa FD-325 SS-3]